MKESKGCKIYYFSDMQRCVKCGQSWDANDPHPPICALESPKPLGLMGRIIARIFGDLQK